MNSRALTVAGIVLFLLGGAMLAYKGITVTREETVLDIGVLDVKTKTKEAVPFPSELGWTFVVCGGLMLVYGAMVPKPA